MGPGVRRERYFYGFMVNVICVYVYSGVEEGGHSCDDIVLSVYVAVREFMWAQRG